MRISDWSSDVCSSDLVAIRLGRRLRLLPRFMAGMGLEDLIARQRRPRARRQAAESGDHARFPVDQRAVTIERKGFEITQRSEEHTSELQSLMRISYAVFCLKKKKKHTNTHRQT